MTEIALKDRIVLITGVSRREGLGFAVAAAATKEGATVLLTARDGAKASALASEIAADGGRLEAYPLDITDQASITDLRNTVEQSHGRLDVLINNAAGINSFGETAEGADVDAAKAAMDVTLFGTWVLTRSFLPLLRQAQHGRVVMVSSGAGSHGDQMFGLGTDNAMGAGYGAAKAALNALTHRMAHEEERQDGSLVRINAICPGFTATFEGGADMGARPPAESASGILWGAKIADDGPNGGFFRDAKKLDW